MSEKTEFIKEVKSDKVGIWVFRIVVIVAGTAIVGVPIRHFYKDFNGQHSVLFWGLAEVNGAPKEIRIHDTVPIKIRDTVKVYSNIGKSKTPIKNEQKIDSGGSGIQNNAPNYGQQSGGDINNNNYGIVPRKITDNDLMGVILGTPKSAKISFAVYTSADAEIYAVQRQIIAIMKKYGYNNIENSFRVSIGRTPPERIEYNYNQEIDEITFMIPPAR